MIWRVQSDFSSIVRAVQEDIRSLLPEALELIRNKLDVLRSSHLDGFERTQLDALQLDVRIYYSTGSCRSPVCCPWCLRLQNRADYRIATMQQNHQQKLQASPFLFCFVLRCCLHRCQRK